MSSPVSLPDRITDHLIAQIITGRLLPGEKLPPYRELAETLGVDQTSLRVALRMLGRMHLLTSVQGSGNVVNDYREVAGLDLLDSLYRIPELEPGRIMTALALDNFLAILQFLVPTTFFEVDAQGEFHFRLALGQIRAAHASGMSSREIAEMDVRGVDQLVKASGNLHVSMLLNSTYRLRLRLTEKMYETIDISNSVDTLLGIFERAVRRQASLEIIREEFRKHLQQVTAGVRAYIESLPETPQLRGAILDRAG